MGAPFNGKGDSDDVLVQTRQHKQDKGRFSWIVISSSSYGDFVMEPLATPWELQTIKDGSGYHLDTNQDGIVDCKYSSLWLGAKDVEKWKECDFPFPFQVILSCIKRSCGSPYSNVSTTPVHTKQSETSFSFKQTPTRSKPSGVTPSSMDSASPMLTKQSETSSSFKQTPTRPKPSGGTPSSTNPTRSKHAETQSSRASSTSRKRTRHLKKPNLPPSVPKCRIQHLPSCELLVLPV